MIPRCTVPVPLADLIAWERGELETSDAERVEEHFFSCSDCTRRLETVMGLGDGIRDLVRSGHLPVAVTRDLVARATESGVRLRTYRLSPGDSVACTAGPDDDFVVVRLATDVAAEESLDLLAIFEDLESGAHEERVTEDPPVDRASGEIVYLYPGDMIRSLPRSRWSVEARVRGPGGERALGPYVLDHTPWQQLPEGNGR